MGATRESSCSGGIWAASPAADDAGAEDCCGAYARLSPGTSVIAHRIATRDLTFAPFRSGFMTTSLMSWQNCCGLGKPLRPPWLAQLTGEFRQSRRRRQAQLFPMQPVTRATAELRSTMLP